MILRYSEASFPPMPVLHVWLATPEESNWQGPYIALIDTGADFSIAPLGYLAALNTFAVENVTLVSYWREPHKVFLYEVDLRFGNLTLPAVDIAGDPGATEFLLGRNVLNWLDLRLDGPRLRTHVRG
jgi:predicted aspartyl protease